MQLFPSPRPTSRANSKASGGLPVAISDGLLPFGTLGKR